MIPTEENNPTSILRKSYFNPTSTDYNPTYPTMYLKYRNNKKQVGKPAGADVNTKSEESDCLDIKPDLTRREVGGKSDCQQDKNRNRYKFLTIYHELLYGSKITKTRLRACLGRLVSDFVSIFILTIVNSSTPNLGVYANCVNPKPKNLVSI